MTVSERSVHMPVDYERDTNVGQKRQTSRAKLVWFHYTFKDSLRKQSIGHNCNILKVLKPNQILIL